MPRDAPVAPSLRARFASAALLTACVLLFLLGLGSMRLVARAWSVSGTRTLDSGVGIAPLVLAIAAAWLLGLFPGPVVEAAMAAARSIF